MKTFLSILTISALVSNAFAYDNLTSSSGEPVLNSYGECWRTSAWTVATAHPACALAPVAKVAAIKESKKVDITAPTAVIATASSIRPNITLENITARTLFDFNKSTIRSEGKAVLDVLAKKILAIASSTAVVTGYTDNKGSEQYNLALGSRRANAVKAYLITKGVDSNRITTESRGEANPIASNATAAGRAKNRRVEIKISGAN